MQTLWQASTPNPSLLLRPDLSYLGESEAADLAACRESLRNGSRTFLAASLMLPRAVREPACALYAFCRMADDEVDGQASEGDAVGRLRARLARAYEGRPFPAACDRALAAMLARYAIPRVIPEALLEGFAWDAEGRRYETLEELETYAARVAGTVGAMMALVMGARDPDSVSRACDLGVAMQLSNIARDVGEDARMGRVYLPLSWLREAGIDPDAWLTQPAYSEALAGVVQRLLRAADALYERVDAGVARLPLSCRPGINAARLLYAAIGHEVQRHGLDSISRRAVVPASRKAWLLARAMTGLFPAQGSLSVPPLAATKFLVEAVAATRPPPAPVTPPRRGVKDQLVGVIDMFERLERRDQMRAAANAL